MKRRRQSSVEQTRLVSISALRCVYMITKEAQRRAHILTMWEKHGLAAVRDVYSVSRSTLYRWKKLVEEAGGKITALNRKKRTPKQKRCREVPWRITVFIITLRKEHPRIGKEKIYPLLKVQCLRWGIKAPSVSTIGRILSDLREQGKLPVTEKGIPKKTKRKQKKLRSTGHPVDQPGHLVQIDTVELYNQGARRYIITAIDVHTRLAYAKAYTRATSASAKDFFKELEHVFPFAILYIQTDNGSEFDKHFKDYMQEQGITHFHTYPKCPRMNAHIERFNRTIQEEFANYHWNTLFTNIDLFQEELITYLLWYNKERPHHALNGTPPLWYTTQYLAEHLNLAESPI